MGPVVEGLAAAMIMFVTYATLLGNREAASSSAELARTANGIAEAPTVSMRLAEVVPVGGEGVYEARYDLEIEFENFGSMPASVTLGKPSHGSFRERDLLLLPPRREDISNGSVRRLRLLVRMSADEVRTAHCDRDGHRFGWTIQVPATVHNMTATVSDELRLEIPLKPFVEEADGGWGRSPVAVQGEPGYGYLLRRLHRSVPTATVTRPEQFSPARPGAASPGRPTSPPLRREAGSRRP
jgi:hypothetical protein